MKEKTHTLPEVAPDVTTIKITVFDGLLNMSTLEVNVPFDNESYIYILEPAMLKMYTESTVNAEGYVTNVNYLEKVLINGTVEAILEFVEDVTMLHPVDGSKFYKGPAFKYTANVGIEDGY